MTLHVPPLSENYLVDSSERSAYADVINEENIFVSRLKNGDATTAVRENECG